MGRGRATARPRPRHRPKAHARAHRGCARGTRSRSPAPLPRISPRYRARVATGVATTAPRARSGRRDQVPLRAAALGPAFRVRLRGPPDAPDVAMTRRRVETLVIGSGVAGTLVARE